MASMKHWDRKALSTNYRSLLSCFLPLKRGTLGEKEKKSDEIDKKLGQLGRV